jgi:metal-dependent HD superfamily phosphatase/phosphodiesterase
MADLARIIARHRIDWTSHGMDAFEEEMRGEAFHASCHGCDWSARVVVEGGVAVSDGVDVSVAQARQLYEEARAHAAVSLAMSHATHVVQLIEADFQVREIDDVDRDQ